ncbi:MAG: hypothetical protein KTQ12_10435 [Dermatophilaceae bacterium]|nr:hypothetical protein [Dermatophilaceae bacterium]
MSAPIPMDPIVLVGAVRYALGRATYIVADTAAEVRRCWPLLDARDRGVIRRDIAEALSGRGPLGMQMDHDVWADLLVWIDEQGSPS